MLIIFIRAIILFAVLLFVIRLMGKRQIGEMEPFELVITLVISELACIPMSDRSIPITFGIVAILTMFVIHQLILLLSKNSKMQNVISGKPVMVLTEDGINLQALDSLNMQVNDLLQAMRSAEYFSLEEVRYGIMETNGQLSVVANKAVESKQKTLPVPVIMDGQWDEDDVTRNKINKTKIERLLRQYNTSAKNVVLCAVDENNRMTLQVKGKNVIFVNVSEVHDD